MSTRQILSMEQFKIHWTAFYFPVHDRDMRGFADIRIDWNAMSAMSEWIRLS